MKLVISAHQIKISSLARSVECQYELQARTSEQILMKKVEEITLYLIELKKENEELRKEIEKLKKKN